VSGMSKANYQASGQQKGKWLAAIIDPIESQVVLAPKRHTAARAKLTLPAVEIVEVTNPQAGVVVFDMGQNMLAYLSLTCRWLLVKK